MINFKKSAIVGALAVAALGLIGAGATATFNTSVAGAQNIQAGTLAVQFVNPTDGNLGNGNTFVQLPSYTSNTDGIDVTDQITLKNTGNVTAKGVSFVFGDANFSNDAALRNDLEAVVTVAGHAYPVSLSGMAASNTLTLTPAELTLTPNQAIGGTIEIKTAASLANAAEGETFQPTFQLNVSS
jgi:hypothetical protein